MAQFRFYGSGLPGVNLQELVGKLIVVEGTDGVGRSTQVALLRQWLEQRGHAVFDTGLTRSALAGKGATLVAIGDAQLLPYLNTYLQLTDDQVPAERIVGALISLIFRGIAGGEGG